MPAQSTRPDVERRFLDKVDRSGDCWIWTAARQKNGYGVFRLDGRTQRAHRVAYELFIAPIPDGMVIDHVCRNRACVNPAHLRACDQRENLLADGSLSSSASYAAQTHCIRGHEFTPENTYGPYAGRGRKRVCRTCKLDYERRRREARAVASG